MGYVVDTTIVCLSLAIGMPVATWIGRRIGQRLALVAETPNEGNGAITGAIFALLGLLIAFTFSGAFSRLDHRRQLFVDEINAIGTAYLRIDLLPEAAQSAIREDFRNYVVVRAAMYDNYIDRDIAFADIDKAIEIQESIWGQAVQNTSGPENQPARMLLLPALNEMFDIVSTRTVAVQTHPPLIIWVTLCGLALVCAGLTGYASHQVPRPRLFFHFVFITVVIFVIVVILDIEYPRYGFVRLDHMNEMLRDLQNSMK